jgi:ABC-type uncharacterized transport system involved in gliding motility auxiliary subunit
MNINKKTHRQLSIQNSLFYILLILAVILLAQLSLKTDISSDWTANNRHTLSVTTTDFLQQSDSEITINAFISPTDQYRSALESLLSRYQIYSDKLLVNYINPEFSPNLVREFNIQQQAEMVISHGEQQVHVYDLSEQSLTNALISVSRQKEQWLVFIEGHGERTPLSQENYNLSTWGEQLTLKGFNFQGVDLIEHSKIPINTAAIVIASPDRAWLEGEINIINNYIDAGGNLVWLADPNTHHFLRPLAEKLNIEFIDGTVLDPNAELLGIADPRFTLVNDYAKHPVGEAVKSVTLFPQAVALESIDTEGIWQAISLLQTPANTWSKAGLIDEEPEQKFHFEQGLDTAGPLSIAYLLSRKLADNDQLQRIAVIGDSDFVSNTYIGNGANLDLGLAIINWLSGDDALINIPTQTTLDNQLDLSKTHSIIIAFGFLIVIPLILFVTGFIIWQKRRQQ